jgi:hypothetical protein
MSTKPVLIELMADTAKITIVDAEVVFEYYRKNKLLNLNAYTGYSVKHGGFLDSAVIKRALEVARNV